MKQKRYLLSFALSLMYYFANSQVSVDVRMYGAQGDSASLNTIFIQEAIDSVNRAGGGDVLITDGVYMSCTIILKSNVTLRITPNATLRAITGDNNYPSIQYSTPSWMDVDYTMHSLIFAENASNIRITGGGTIDGNGDDISWLGVSNKNLRPFGLRLHLIQNLDIDSINLIQAPQWMGHIFQCQNVHIYQVRIYNQCWGSNDGIDIDCSRNVLMEDCNFDTNDDSAPVKTHCTDTCRDVTIRNCTFATFERAVKVGNECFGPIINVHFENITVNQSSFTLGSGLVPLNVMYIAVADGGSIDSVFFDNIHINTPSQTSIFIKLCMRDFQYNTNIPPPLPKYLKDVWISNVFTPSSTSIPCSISGLPGYDLQNIHLENVTVTVPGGGPAGYPTVSEQATTRPECTIWGDSLPAYGLFVWHVNGLTLDSFCVDTLSYDQRPEYDFSDTANIQKIGNGCISIPSAVTDLVQDEINIYPNPASGFLNISNIPPQAEAIALYAVTGSRVLIAPVLGRRFRSLDVSGLPAGVYFATFIGSNYSLNRKLLITR